MIIKNPNLKAPPLRARPPSPLRLHHRLPIPKTQTRIKMASSKSCGFLLSSPISPFSAASSIFRCQIAAPALRSLFFPSGNKKVPLFGRSHFSTSRSSSNLQPRASEASAADNGRTPLVVTEYTVPRSDLFLYNTMSKEKELFRPKVPRKVGMYVCGVTAYDLSHIGHARVYVTFDILFRYLQHLDYEVCYVRNFTDVDDKIIVRAHELGEDPLSLSRRYCDEFHADMAELQCLPPAVEPRVSDHMNQIIDMIKKIIDKGFAYNIDGNVFFSVQKFPAYGHLSGRKPEDNRAGERVSVDSRKQNPADFALWKSAKAGEPSWESPWGPGRPGWHIECSAMSAAYLGYSFDIHGGGMDLVFPHHENEIAQSCAACSNSSINYWIHNGFVTVNEEKMSKSLRNFFTIREVLQLYHPLALRLFLIGTHYRSPINYSTSLLDTASDRLFYIYQTLHDCEKVAVQHTETELKDSLPADIVECIRKSRSDIEKSMSDDLHTPVALASISEPLRIINDLLHTRKGKKRELRLESILALKKEITKFISILGLEPLNYHEALEQLRAKALKRAGVTEEEILQKIEDRNAARKTRQYEKSDEIRKQLATLGIALMDGPDGTTWRPTVPDNILKHSAST